MLLIHRILAVAMGAAAVGLWAQTPGATDSPARELVGLWRAKHRFGPDVRGTLTVERDARGWRAEIAGRPARVEKKGEQISFELADGQGALRGTLRNDRIAGHWIQPRMVTHGSRYASPVTLESRAPGRWIGTVAPLDDEMTFYLPIRLNADGTLGAFLRNPERNVGRFLNVERVAFDGRTVKLLGRRSREAPETVVGEGPYDADNKTFSIYIPARGASFDFLRASDESDFYPRGRTPAPYAYHPPPDTGDGWSVGTLEDARISREGVRRFIQLLIETPMDSIHASDIHGVLIARHGKLVLEEYFHGFHRDLPHDTRSASKSVTSALTGAAILHTQKISPSTPVYATMDATPPVNPDPRKRGVTVRTLLTMSPGLDCDDSDPASPGQEDTMQEQTAQPDWYRFTLDLKLVRAPGEKATYCSGYPNLLGGVLSRTTGRWLPDLFRDLIADPLQIRRYAMNLTPTGDAYMGGGLQIPPRDFMKLGQVMLGSGRWNGRQIVSPDWARTSISPLYELGGIHYGYLWWVRDYPYKGRTVRAFFAGGNGGQIVMGVPELDLVIAFYGGNYSDPVLFVPQRVYVPEYILPAIQ